MSVAVSIILGISMTACGSSVKGEEIVATINGKDITRSTARITSVSKIPPKYPASAPRMSPMTNER